MTEPTDPQRWLLAIGAILNRQNGHRLDRLGGGPRPTHSWTSVSTLRQGWRAFTTAEVEGALGWLLREGHRTRHEADGRGPAAELVGWDAARIANVAGWAYAGYLLDGPTAWSWHLEAARLLSSTYGSWAELGQSYLRGLREWASDDPKVVEPTAAAVAWLVSDPESPWARLPFDRPTFDVPPFEPPLSEVRVAPGETILAAIQRAPVNARVIVPAGTYRGSITVDRSIELVAEGEVVIESSDRPALWVEGTRGVVARGITFRTVRAPDGPTLNAVSATRGFVRLERCDVSATHDGVQLRGWATGQVVDCTVHDCGSAGLNLIGGALVAERTEVRGSASGGVLIAGEGASRIVGCTITGSVGPGIRAAGSVTGVVAKCTLADNGGAATVVLAERARLEVVETTVRDGKGGGVFAQGESRAFVAASAIERCALAAIDVATTQPMGVEEVVLKDNASSGVVVRGGASLSLVASELHDSRQGHVWVMGGGRAELRGCRITLGALAVWAQGRVLVHRCELEGQTGVAIDAQPGGAVTIDQARVIQPGSDAVLAGEGADVQIAGLEVTGNNGMVVRAAAGARVVMDAPIDAARIAGEVAFGAGAGPSPSNST